MLRKFALAGAVVAVATTAVFAASHGGGNPAVKARQSLMGLYGFNIGILGAMAQGKAEYDAKAASAAASNLAALTKIDQSAMWPAGTDTMSIEGTRALPAIWEDFPGVMAKAGDVAAAADAMAAAAGNGLEALQAAMGPLGAACGACHKAYREPQ